MYPSSWLLKIMLFEKSIPVVIESFVKYIPFYLNFYISVNFIEWSEDPVATEELLNQQTELIVSL